MISSVGGNPTVLREMSRSLTAGGLRLLGISNALADLQTADRWESPAGERFARAIAGVLPVLRALHRRFATAAGVLESYAQDVEDMQRRAERASDELRRAESSIQQGWQVVQDARNQPDAAQIEQIFLQRERDLATRMGAIQLDYDRAASRFSQLDRQYAATLRELLSDSIADSSTYRVLAELDEAGDRFGLAVSGMSMVPLPLAQVPAAAADIVFGASRLSLLVFYDEGSWRSLATSSAFWIAARAAAAARNAAVAKGRFTRAGELINPQIATKQRLAVGTEDALADSIRSFVGVKVTPVVKDARPPTKFSGTTMRPRERVRALATQAARKNFLNDWQVATANGPQMQALYLTGRVGGHALSGAKWAATKPDRANNPAPPLCAGDRYGYSTPKRAASAANLSLGVCDPQVSGSR